MKDDPFQTFINLTENRLPKPEILATIRLARDRIFKTVMLKKRALIKYNDLLLFTAGIYAVRQGQTNLIKIQRGLNDRTGKNET